MSEEAEDIEVVLDSVGSADPDIKIEAAEEKPEEKRVIEPDEGIEALRAQLEHERKLRSAQAEQLNQLSQTAYKAQTEAHDNSLSLVSNAIDTLRQNSEILKAHYSNAMAASDFNAAADVQLEMSNNAARLLQLEQGKQALENQPKPQQQQYVNPDPVEALASQLSPRSAAWIRAHPEFARDERLYRRMLAAHNLAETDGIPVDSDDYFDSIESTLRIRPREVEPMAEAAQITQRRQAPPAAPVTRSGNGTGSRPNVVRLNDEEREMASNMGMTEKEYALNKLALQKAGRLN